MGKVGQPDVVAMTSGGNNASFGHIIDVCIYHSDSRHDYRPAYKDDIDGTGDCAVALNNASNYIDNVMQQDLINTMNDIFDDTNVKNNAGFLLYLTGYAQFFGTDMDPWCNDENWNIPNLYSARPYLSVELRTAFNDRVSKVNTLYHNIIQSNFADKARFIDVDSGFSGHRFCGPGASRDDQLNTDTDFDGVCLWNLNWPWQVSSSVPAPNPNNASDVSVDEAEQLFGSSNDVTAWTGGSGSGGGGNDPSSGWRLRPFHPRYTGYTAIKNAIISQLKTDGLLKAESGSSPPSTTAPAQPPSTPTPPAYAPGTCSFHLGEWEDCADISKNLFAQITMYDNNKVNIGQTTVDPAKNPLGDPINDGDSLSFESKLPFSLVVTGEHANDYVQFNYNGLQWQSRDTTGPAKCTVGGWDPRDGPV